MSRDRTPAWFPVPRTTFDDPLLDYGARRYSRREAWQWLRARAAWKPRGHRHVLGITDLRRGQLALTVRELGAAWRWPRSNVHRFLKLLAREGRIELDWKSKSGTTNGTINARSTRWRTVVTICNYDEFQSPSAAARQKRDNEWDYKWDYETPYLPGIIDKPESQQGQQTQEDKDSERGGLQGLQPVNYGDNSSTTAWRSKPGHGAISRNGKFQWFDYPSSEWSQAARLHEADKGARVFPKIYREGRGNWFKRRTDAEIRFLFQKICEREGIPKVPVIPGPRWLPKPNASG